jgi:hypothetical protein
VPDREPSDWSELQPAQAEHLLDGSDFIDDPEPIALILAAARAAGRPYELRGEEAAVAAFHLARFDDHQSPRANPPAWARVLTVKAVVLALLIGVASVALAAGVRVVVAPASSQNPDTPSPAAAHKSTANAPSSVRPPSSPTLTPTPTPTSSPADMAALCQAYRKQDHPHPEDSATGSPYSPLFLAAGGTDKVAAFCAHLDAGATDKPTHTPAPPGANHHSPTPSTGPSLSSPPTNGG